jgi:hypothetical protein
MTLQAVRRDEELSAARRVARWAGREFPLLAGDQIRR